MDILLNSLANGKSYQLHPQLERIPNFISQPERFPKSIPQLERIPNSIAQPKRILNTIEKIPN
jgi:hypothetical protein